MTRKHYEALVKALADVAARNGKHAPVITEAVLAVAEVCAADNARFNRDKFLAAYTAYRAEFAKAQA